MMEKNTLWQWAFNLLSQNTDTPESRKPMAVPNSPARGNPLQGSASLTEDEWNKQCNLRPALQITNVPAAYAKAMRGMAEEELRELRPRQAPGVAAGEPQRDQPLLPPYGMPVPVDYPGTGIGITWRPGIEHNQPHPVKENPDGTLYYKGCVYRKVGDHRRNKNTQKSKRRQG